jgi:hypothetical protein
VLAPSSSSAGSGYQAGGCELVCAGAGLVTGGGAVDVVAVALDDVVAVALDVAFSTECCQREKLGMGG